MPRGKKQAKLDPPPDLEKEAVEEWNRIVAAAKQTGRALKPADQSMLLLYCKTWIVNRKMHDHVQQHGAVIKWPNGTPGPSPMYKVFIETAKQLQTILTSLGCTPASRDFDKVKGDAPAPPPPLKF